LDERQEKYLKKNSALSEGLDLENPSKTIIKEIYVELPTCSMDEVPKTSRI